MSTCLDKAKGALEKRAQLINELRGVADEANMSDAEKREREEKLDNEIRSLESLAALEVDNHEREQRAGELNERIATLTKPTTVEPSKTEARGEDLNDQFRAIARGELRNVEIPFSNRDGEELRIATTANAANAGTTIERTFVREVLEALRDNSPFLQTGVRIVTTSSGEEMVWPVKNGRLIAYLVPEKLDATAAATYTKSDMSFTRWSVGAYKYGVMADASFEMLEDSELNLASLIATDMGEALADKTSADFLLGDGVNKPDGLSPAVTLGPTGGTIATTLTFDNLIDTEHSVIEKYRRNAVWYVSDSVVRTLRKIKDADGRYIWQPAVTVGQPSSLLGKAIYTDPNMPANDAVSSKVVLYGDFSKYLVRIAKGVEVSRSEEYGWDRDVISFKARTRVDGGVYDGAAFAALRTPAT